jgi:3-oxoacyl-[acyl-carrier-protein] synthase III
MSGIKAAITGIHSWTPDYVLTNAELETLMDTTDEWITTRTGIKERRLLKEPNTGSSYLATKAVEGLLEKTGTKPEEVEFLIVATATPDMLFPATANLVTGNLGMVNAGGYDISAACSGFLFALTTASKLIEAGMYKKIIVVGADKMSSIVDLSDRTTGIIFGDGAGAVLLEPSQDENGIIDCIMRSDGQGVKHLHQKAGGSLRPASAETVARNEHKIYQEGQVVFKFAVTRMADVAAEIMERNHLTAEDVAYLAPHQANKRIIDATASRMGIGPEKVMLNIHKYGNTTNGTIPIVIHEYEKKLKKGDNIIIAAFGGGFTWGAIYLKWSYDSK